MEKSVSGGSVHHKKNNSQGWKRRSKSLSHSSGHESSNASVLDSELSESHEMQDSRQKRFEKTLEGNRFEELRASREEERKEAIKKGLIDDPSKPRQLNEAVTFTGTCMDMCPEYEREQREYQNNLEKWEINPKSGRVDKDLAVKAFHRPAAGNEQALPSDVRPPHILKKSLDYLIDEIVCGPYPLESTHFFVRDRTRSIRQDFTLQNSRGLEAIACHERIARYHILCLHQLCEQRNFSSQQEMEQLRKVLQSLCEFYDDMRKENKVCPNESEFRCYAILAHIRDPDIARQAQNLPDHIFRSKFLQTALRLSALAQKNNERVGRLLPPNTEAAPNLFTRFFKLTRSDRVTYLMACLLEVHFSSVRKGALKAMRRSYLSAHARIPCADIQKLLYCDAIEEVIELCEHYGLEVVTDDSGSLNVILNKSVNFDETRPELKQRFSHALVECKRSNATFATIINAVGEHDASQTFSKPSISVTPVSTRQVKTGTLPNTTLTKAHAPLVPTKSLKRNGLNIFANEFIPKVKSLTPTLAVDAAIPLSIPSSLTTGTKMQTNVVSDFFTSKESKPINEKLASAVVLPPPPFAESEKTKPELGEDFYQSVLTNVMQNVLTRMVNAAVENVVDTWASENSLITLIQLLQQFVWKETSQIYASEYYQRRLCLKKFRLMMAMGKRCYATKQLRLQREQEEKEKQEHYISVYENVMTRMQQSTTKVMNPPRVYDGSHLEPEYLEAQKLNDSIRQAKEMRKSLNLASLLHPVTENMVYDEWTMAAYCYSPNSSITSWLCNKLCLRPSNGCFLWEQLLETNKSVRVYMPCSTVFDDLRRANYGACLYVVDVSKELQCLTCSDSQLEYVFKNSPKLEETVSVLHRFIQQLSQASTTKFPLLIVFWATNLPSMDEIAAKFEFMKLVQSDWSAVSSIHVQSLDVTKYVALDEGIETLVSNRSTEPSPAFRYSQFLRESRKRHSVAQSDIEASKVGRRRYSKAFVSEDESHVYSDELADESLLTPVADIASERSFSVISTPTKHITQLPETPTPLQRKSQVYRGPLAVLDEKIKKAKALLKSL
ncbi:nuclear export factor Sac3 [Schizosaccharomyces japonicus yFS275]|uniref:Nuclear mRNA export factor n=1 Tax=Schizosaccharomyces japonicus (strain yFS275 / FY16936) TaxID=402676 RepID=B6K6X2_SCHJY|nr:nuclear export factor Sac3 [Schizosaccharomyces japonicus yFS275]EEB09276.1 nuclear export factor Sac3 [Schizosaccharomyces japonicus yFS275]